MTQHLDPTIPPNLDPTIPTVNLPTVNLTYTTPPSRGGLITAVAVLLVLVGVAAGVLVSQHNNNNNNASPSHSSAAPSATTPSPDPTYSTDQLFLVTVRRVASKDLSYYSDKELIETAHAVCDALTAGSSYADLIEASTSTGMSAYDAGVLLGGAETQYCPSYS